MSDDDLDRRLDARLRAAGEAWRSTRDLPEPQVPVPTARRRGWVVPVAAAASVALLAGAAVVLATALDGDGDRADVPPAADGPRWDPDLPPGLVPADVPGAVPPVNQPVTYPAAEVAGAFTPALTDVVERPQCSADDVDLGLGRGDGDGEVSFRLEARDGATCVVSRYPYLEYARDGEPVEVLARTPDPGAGDWPESVLVAPGRSAVLPTTWAGWCEAPPFDTVVMFFDDNTDRRLGIEGAVTGCTGDPEDLPDRMVMTGWEPETWTLDPPADFSGLRARLVDEVRGPGGLPTWVVEVTAPRDVDLDTCPSWEVRQGDEESASWRLNCEAVPHRRGDGTPYLPAGEPVRFAVWTSYGDTDATLTWRLTTPDGPVSLSLSEGPQAPTGPPRLVAEQEANLHLLVSNQAFEQPEVGLTLSVDGVVLVDQRFEVEGQHTYVPFEVAVPAGEHRVVLTSDTGARLERAVTIPARGDRWALASYWQDGGGEDDGRFDWLFEASPIGVG